MRTIKNAMILTLVVCVNVFFTSCSDDDTPQDTLIGKWQILKDVASNGEVDELTECEKKAVLEFKSDNTFKDVSYEENMNNECVSYTEEGKWKEKGDNILEVTREGEIEEVKYYFVDGNLKFLGEDEEGKENGSYTLYQKI
ncbi:lipocalin family protein [Tenacibaculum sp. 1B UA]|uniref:lipocalin family protein n=1 Tax=unclassified Tenacibaculum TaxID=2635139 RepID=UPI0026E126D9|nr:MULTISPECIES: lipocalin family protein [unclassified Tenacibaculum]MDO6674801.1 lipocalin family protein [Tenacibaculum sp. 1_MG-2023]MDX8553255.1 lipocalin family protein [Tenacibaculum sp. 1B UA]